MDALLTLVIGLAIGAALGLGVSWLLSRRGRVATDGSVASEAAEAELAATKVQLVSVQAELAELRPRAAALEATATLLREQAATQAQGHENQLAYVTEQARERVELLRSQTEERIAAQEAQHREQLADQAERIRELQERIRELQDSDAARQKEDGRVLLALSPVKQTLTAMQEKVAELEKQRQQQYGELSQQLRSASESEERLRSTAESLASALRSNSTRGVWGETQLRSVVEAAGLIERVDFDVQTTISSDSGAGRPDMVVHLPGGKNIAVDAKVPFDAYLEASAIPATAAGADLDRRTQLLDRHVKALRAHITALGSKGYWNGLEASPELVIAFIPSESLVSSALEADPGIMEFAFAKRVALASPVTLWSVLKTVAFSWQQDVLTQEARQLFDLSQELYGRLGTTAGHISKLGRTIDRSVKDYNAFIGSFERKVFPTARKLAALSGDNLFEPVEAIEETPREVSAHELLAELEVATPAALDAAARGAASAPEDADAQMLAFPVDASDDDAPRSARA
ncbi:DNA recombination protein RmuC [Cnuibacter physcomitrellae]|uniref:DNA recombination protein RmuC n=1 Tax=Cnuibacter physcomitrellae TaxID=1619308 RepID=UPI002175B9BA|nr:DNA recombination protein RmuC [Cnuibacter physcomitrellae]MCS5496552.1 DNA recombination protein RmuC [Cnuibacter physcomitrellae]